jgi:hypothetical protein
MSAEIDGRGRVVFDHVAHDEWPSLEVLATAYWAWVRSTDRHKASEMSAWHCVHEFMAAASPHAIEVIQVLIDRANPDELVHIGAGPLETLLSHAGHGRQFVDEIERRARQQPTFRTAVASVWLGADVPQDVRTRLAALGATILKI